VINNSSETMMTAEILDFERLLSPVSADNPCGESLRWDPVWDELSQFRKTRKDPLDSSADQVPEWGKVARLASDVLATRTKDLLIAGWLTEALVRERGFPGFRDGLKLIRGLVEQFWDDVYPIIEDDDLSMRAAPFTWLTSKDGGARMPIALRDIPLALSAGDEVFNWSYWHARLCPPRGKDEEEDSYAERCALAERKKQLFDAAVEATPLEFYRTLIADMDACLAEIDQLANLADDRLGDQAPGWGDLRKTIHDIQVFVRDVLKRRGVSDEETTTAAAPTNGEATGSAIGMSISGPIRSRAEAITRLEEVARFFGQMDPHSPVAYLVRRAIRWAGMSFEDLLAELVKDDSTLKQIGETLGMQPHAND
jgi:type VI secretion system protein ImpA